MIKDILIRIRCWFAPWVSSIEWFMTDGSWVDDPIRHLIYSEQHKYLNTLSRNRGRYQNAIATVRISKMKYKYNWRWPKSVKVMDVKFNRHMGSGASSWSGGVKCATFEMKAGEDISDTIERMQIEYKFE